MTFVLPFSKFSFSAIIVSTLLQFEIYNELSLGIDRVLMEKQLFLAMWYYPYEAISLKFVDFIPG